MVLALLSVSSPAAAQETSRLRALLDARDSVALRAEVTRRPNDARDVLREIMAQASHADAKADSIFQSAFRLATTYTTVWADSFPLTNLGRFVRSSPEQRLAKVAADSVRLAGNAAYEHRGPAAAISVWRAALRRSRALADTAGIAATLGNIGAGFYRLSSLDSAELYLGRARQLAEAVGDNRTAANATGTLASLAKDRGDLARAETEYRRALTLRTRIGDVIGASADHNNLGLIAVAVGDVGAAREHYDEALRIAREQELDDAAATALLNLGNLASSEANYAEAVGHYNEALRLNRKLESYADVALTLQNLGLLDLRTGDYRSARDRLLEALSLLSKVGTVEDVVETRRDLAAVDAAMGNLRNALTQLREAERLLARDPATADLAAGVALTHADIAVQLNEFAEAERQYGVAQSLYRRAGDQVGEAEAREGSASLLIKRQQYAQAQSQLEAIVRSQVAIEALRPAALSRLTLGYVREQRGDTLGARRLITMARDTLHRLRDVVGEAAAWAALGGLDLARRSPLAAEAEYRRGIAVLGTRAAPSVSWQLHAGLGEALHAHGAAAEAAVELRSAIGEVERMAATLPAVERRSMFLTDKWQPYEDLALIQRETGSDGDAFVVSERMRGRQMLDLVSRAVVSRPPTADSEAVAREHDLRRRIAELTQRLERQHQSPINAAARTTVGALRGPDIGGQAETGATREALAQAQEEYEHVLIALQDQSGGGEGAEGVSSWQSVARTLRRDQALLEYLVTDSTTLLFVVRSDTMRALDLGVGRQSLASLIEFARGTMGRVSKRSTPAWRGPLRRLYAQLVAPVEDSGMLDGVRELVIVPHGELHYLPFAALIRSGQREQFLLERYDVGYAPSATVWLRLAARGSSANTNVLALAPRASALPGSRDEVQAIAALYGRDATVLTDQAASERAFREAASRFGIVHFATYGVLNQHNPLFSFVELNADSTDDGRLEVHEVFGMQLRARLVVLSACQTGLASGLVSDVPAGDDWIGLVRAFLSAGAEHVVATLWAVEDRSTARLMERLHRKFRAGMSAVAALSAAQRETLRNADTAGPFYWAGFVAVGGGTR